MKKTMIAIIATCCAIPALAASNDVIDNAAKETNAVKTKSGLVYVPLREGKGNSPTAASVVEVNYKGMAPNGKEFDSTYKRNKSVSFPLNRALPCVTEGVQMMKVGGKAKLVCPPELAYGHRSHGSDVPPHSTVIIEVELLNIK